MAYPFPEYTPPPEVAERLRKTEAKWLENGTSAGANTAWIKNLAEAADKGLYEKGVADFLGVSPSDVAAQPPAAHWKDFARNARLYLDKRVEGMKSAAGIHKWIVKYALRMCGKIPRI